jgi:hypothetical protein
MHGELREAHEYLRQHNLEHEAAVLRDIIAVASAESGFDFTTLLS